MRQSLILTAVLLGAVSISGAQTLPGPFVLNTGLTFYLVNPGGTAFELTLHHRDEIQGTSERPTIVRVFDPAENLILRHEWAGLPRPEPTDETLKVTIPAAGPGIYQVIVTGWYSTYFAFNTIDLTTEPLLPFGVHGHLQELCGMKDQFADTCIYLPPGLRELPVTVSGSGFTSLSLSDEQGTEQLRLDKETREGTVSLPADEGQVWRLQAEGSYYGLDFSGLPIILCPTPEVARAIRASVDIMADGTICFHKHQIAAWELLQEYKTRPRGDYEVPVPPMEELAPYFLSDPARSQLLFGQYGTFAQLVPALATQCLDPASPWFGSINVWLDAQGQPRRENPLADYNRLGLEEFAALSKNLAALYCLKADFNPCYHNPQLRNRLIIATLLDLLVMKEGEFCSPDNTYYVGIHAFTLSHNHSGTFGLMYPEMPAEVQALWLAGEQRLIDRFLYGTVGGCTNQWLVLLGGLWRFYEGTGLVEYREAILRNLHWLIKPEEPEAGQIPVGYMSEASGPDATYHGISTHYLAEIYHASRDPAILEFLRHSFNFFNHTVAPEPEGNWLGSSGYCHRTPGDWSYPQYGAGLGVMAEYLPEAGVRFPRCEPWLHPRPPVDEASRQQAEAALQKIMHYQPENFYQLEKANTSRSSGAFDIGYANWRNYSTQILPGTLPCEEAASFTRNFGDEFLCIKRPAYYAFLFSGVCYGLWQTNTRPQSYDQQFPHNDGLALVWSPQFGSSLLSKNWNAGTANTLLAELENGEIEWPWYWDTSSDYDTQGATATLSGRINRTTLNYQRTYHFADDYLSCTLKLTTDKPLKLRKLSESLPFPLPDSKTIEVQLLTASGEQAASGTQVKGIYFTNVSGYGHLVVLEQPRLVEVGQHHSTDHYGGERNYGAVAINLPHQWAEGQEFRLTYRIIPCPADEVTQYLK
jgi:hypothetical protein